MKSKCEFRFREYLMFRVDVLYVRDTYLCLLFLDVECGILFDDIEL